MSSSISISDGDVSIKLEDSDLGESLDVESITEVFSYFVFSDVNDEIKLDGSYGSSERGASGAMVDMVEGILTLDVDAVAVAVVTYFSSILRLGVICY